MTEKEIEVVKVKCPNCGSEELDMPENIEKRGECFFIKGTNLQLHTLPMIAYVCSQCGREISSDEVFNFIGHNESQLKLRQGNCFK